MKDSLLYLVQLLLKKNNISFDKDELFFQIQSHPSYPSLHAVTGVLDHFGIENVAAEVFVDANTLHQLPDCFLGQIDASKEKDLVIIEKKKESYWLYYSENKKEKLTTAEFLTTFTGILVAVEGTLVAKTTKHHSRFMRITILALVISFLGFLLVQKDISIPIGVHFLLSIIGGMISIAILKQELGLLTIMGNAFCAEVNDKKDCDAVLTSKGASVIKGYKLSDLSVLYFTSLALFTFFSIEEPTLVYIISGLAIPITLYSLYYQYVVVKKWCLLCVSIVTVLWAQTLIFIVTAEVALHKIAFKDIIIFAGIVLISGIVWSYVKPLLQEVNELRKEKITQLRFKRNFELFNSLLQKSPVINSKIKNSKEIVLGNPNANVVITSITNPFCVHCRPVHQQLDQILYQYQEDVKIVIRFNVNTRNHVDDTVKVASRLVELYHTEGKEVCLQAMNDIYQGEAPDTWLQKWGDCIEKELYISELAQQSLWCVTHNINFTPEILVNGRSYPKEYDRSDLIFFIEDLVEEHTNQVIEKPVHTMQVI